ncbi:uncharacterized protein L201_001629 [Kwoniella dendrophila CBS 6074]|uniref:mRNA export factor GLE1 n=1 Tax=Kwoniella dendrophila CBS 6074 TaxID=1295534 RepID=A0AAX4JNV0_9TREE
MGKFALEDSSDDDSISSLDYSISSDEEFALSPSRNPRSTLGRNILTAYETSEEEDLNSEDEVNFGLDDEWDIVKKKSQSQPHSKEKKEKSSPKDIKGKGKSKLIASLSYKVITPRKSIPTLNNDYNDERVNQFDDWLKTADQEAWRDGQKQANQRRGEIRNIATNARARIQSQEEARLAKEAEELRKMLEGMSMKHDREEEELERKFREREKKLWDDIDAAIKDVERREAELAAATTAAAKRQKAEDEARAAQAEKLALAQKEEAEKLAKDQAEQQRSAQAVKEEEERKLSARKEEEAAQEAAQAKVAEEKDRAGSEWRKWVQKQKWLKSTIIEPVKNDRAIRTALKQGMRLMTRFLGQVTNDQKVIVRVTNDLHAILSEQLPSPPSASTPISLNDDISKAYEYLLSHLSKALIKQAESEVNAKADAAFPLARIVLGLLLRGHAALGEVVFARFVKKCPWVIPYYPARQNGQSREEYEKSTGRGSDESVAEYISRMAGTCTLYFAILQTPLASLIPTVSTSPPTPTQLETLIIPELRFPSAWTWLALALRDPLPSYPPIAHLVSTWIDITGHEAVRVYGNGQMGKIWEVIEREGLGEGKIKGDSEAARQKLRLTLEKWRRGEFIIPNGRVWE